MLPNPSLYKLLCGWGERGQGIIHAVSMLISKSVVGTEVLLQSACLHLRGTAETFKALHVRDGVSRMIEV